MPLIKKTYQSLIVVVVLLVIALAFHFKTINQFPQYRHCWAQCDRYALALGFIDNGGDLFHPQSFVYNNQFPDDFETIKNNSITSVDFPVHDYIVSWLMKLFHKTSPWVFRLYILFYSLVGFFYLFKLSCLFTASFVKQVTVLLFALSSSTILYYQAGFLPTIPSIANTFISLYFYFNYLKNKQSNYFIYAILFLTIAVLARLPFAIILVAIGCFELLQLLKNKKVELYKIIVFAASFTIIGLYFLYNSYLRNHYGSLFLNKILPASNFSELKEFLATTSQRWLFQYFSIYHYMLLLCLILFFGLNKLVKKIAPTVLSNQLMVFTLIAFVGCCLYYILMAFQFLNHDYYFLDTFYLPLALLFMFLVSQIPDYKSRWLNHAINSGLLLVLIPMFLNANSVINNEKKQEFYQTKTTAESFSDVQNLFNSLSIPKQAKTLTIGTDGVNNPFILMQRKGYTVISAWDSHKIEIALTWPYDYVVLENARIVENVYANYPQIINKLTKIGGNEDLSIYSKKTDNQLTDVDAFLGLDTKAMQYHQLLNFDSIPENFSNTNSIILPTISKQKIGFVDSLNEYGLTHYIRHVTCLNSAKRLLKISANYFIKKPLTECLICVSIKSKGKELKFLAQNIGKHKMAVGHWQKVVALFSVPLLTEPDIELDVFIWNVSKNNLYYNTIEYTIY